MKPRMIFLFFILFLIFFVFLYTNREEEREVDNTIPFSSKVIFSNDSIVDVSVMKTPEELEKGLSGTKNLPYGRGMLFVFEKPGKYSFWMKDMSYSIDILWISESKEILYIKENALPNSYPKESYVSKENALYVLELPSGYTLKNDIKVGDKVDMK